MPSEAWRLVPTNSTRPPPATTSLTLTSAWCSSGTVCARSMMWMLLRAPKMKGAIFGIPAVALVAEVTASFEQLAHIEGGKRHGRLLFRLNLRGTCEKAVCRSGAGPPERRAGLSIRRARGPACVMAAV